MGKNKKLKSTRRQNLPLIKRFLPYYKPYKRTLALDMLCAVLTTVCELYLPIVVREITEKGMQDPALLATSRIIAIGLTYIALRILDAAANYYMNGVGHIMGTRIETDMRRDMFAHLHKLSFSFYDETKVGQIMSRITSDLFDVTEFAHHCPEEIFITSVKVIGAFTILCFINVPLTLIIFSLLPLMVMVVYIFNKRMRAAFKKSREKIGDLNAQVEDSLLGVRVVKSFANEKIEEEKFAEGNKEFFKAKKHQYHYMAGFTSSTRFVDGLMYIVVVVAGAFFVKNEAINSADLIAYLLYVTTLLNSIRRIADFAEQFQRGLTGIERFAEIMDTPITITDSPDAVELEEVKGDIDIEDVSFRYSDKNDEVFRNIDLHIKSGENIALVGPSGSGKTTLCSLIPRFYDVTGGRISIDGKDIRSIRLSSLRSKIGVVQQDVYLFSGTVLENIEYGCPGASKEEIIEAAKQAGAHEFIEKLPEGYNTYVGERGVKLSGGQKQRISIARVFLKNPPILIMDEATSSLDNESEHIVQHSLERLAKGRTTFTVAHRLTTIKNADTILVLTEKGIEEQGSHEQLMQKNGIYSSLYGMYSTQ